MKLILVNNNGGKQNEDDLGENQKWAKSTVKKVYIKVLEILRFCRFDLVAHGKLEWTGG